MRRLTGKVGQTQQAEPTPTAALRTVGSSRASADTGVAQTILAAVTAPIRIENKIRKVLIPALQ
jgi:hypothetical protein